MAVFGYESLICVIYFISNVQLFLSIDVTKRNFVSIRIATFIRFIGGQKNICRFYTYYLQMSGTSTNFTLQFFAP
jgi:hypothetical protein